MSCPVVGSTSLSFRHPPGPWATPCWCFPNRIWLVHVTYLLGYDGNDQILYNPSMDHFGWNNVKRVGVAGFQKCSKTLTGRAAEFAELIPGEQLARSPDVVVVREGQNVTVPSEL